MALTDALTDWSIRALLDNLVFFQNEYIFIQFDDLGEFGRITQA